MNASSPTRNGLVSGLAESRAADVSAGRQRLDAGRETLERYRASELAEAEALALARIKADTERALAHQAQTLRDSERAAELVAIERRSTDLEAVKEAQRREVLDHEARTAAAARAEADRRAELAAQEKNSALKSAHEAHHARLKIEREALIARRGNRRARITLAWMAIRSVSPIAVGLLALLLGIGSGWLIAELRGNTQAFSAIDEAPLKIDTELSVLPKQH